MWVFVMFDLPVKKKKDRKQATQFRKFLISDGYLMLHFSVYARICNGEERVEKHYKRVITNLPKKGSVRVFQLTDKQYGRMSHFLGQKKTEDEIKNAQQSQLVLL